MILNPLTLEEWIARYGGQQLLAKLVALHNEGQSDFDVVPCTNCDDPICHGWRVVPREKGDNKR